jgi:hypothetical protein
VAEEAFYQSLLDLECQNPELRGSSGGDRQCSVSHHREHRANFVLGACCTEYSAVQCSAVQCSAVQCSAIAATAP